MSSEDVGSTGQLSTSGFTAVENSHIIFVGLQYTIAIVSVQRWKRIMFC